jgi:ribonuclease P protein component
VFQRAYNGRKSTASEYFTLYVLNREGKVHSEVKSRPDTALDRSSRLSASPGEEGAPVSQVEKAARHRLPLVGFVVSKKVIKSACGRNRAKRRMREAYRLLRSGGKRQKGVFSGESIDVISSLQQWYALVWVINEKVLKTDWQEICKTMEGCLLEASKKYGQRRSLPEKKRSGTKGESS